MKHTTWPNTNIIAVDQWCQSSEVFSFEQMQAHSSSAGSITVRSDGTFDAQASIPTRWQPNSQHVIQAQATGQDGRVLAQAQ